MGNLICDAMVSGSQESIALAPREGGGETEGGREDVRTDQLAYKPNV